MIQPVSSTICGIAGMSTNVLLLLKKPNVDGGIYGISIVNIIVKMVIMER